LSYLSVLLSWIELGQEVDFNNQNISWATKPSLVVAPGAIGHKSKFQTLTQDTISESQRFGFLSAFLRAQP